MSARLGFHERDFARSMADDIRAYTFDVRTLPGERARRLYRVSCRALTGGGQSAGKCSFRLSGVQNGVQELSVYSVIY